MILVFVAIIMSGGGVEAARKLMAAEEDFAGANHLANYPAMYEKARHTMSFWLERLSSGPSPRGPGH